MSPLAPQEGRGVQLGQKRKVLTNRPCARFIEGINFLALGASPSYRSHRRPPPALGSRRGGSGGDGPKKLEFTP